MQICWKSIGNLLEICSLTPYKYYVFAGIFDKLSSVLLYSIRVGQTRRCLVQCKEVMVLLSKLKYSTDKQDVNETRQGLLLKSEWLAKNLATKRHFMVCQDEKEGTQGCVFEYDPRYLVFEFT